jgi:hypothetical protein
MSKATDEAMNALRLDIADRLCEIEDLCRDYNVPMPAITLIARDPALPEMYTVVTSDKDLAAAARLALRAAAQEAADESTS